MTTFVAVRDPAAALVCTTTEAPVVTSVLDAAVWAL
jgi:hypothetical protein